VRKDKATAGGPADQTGEIDPAQRLAAYLADEKRPIDLADEESPIGQTPSAPDRGQAVPVSAVPVPSAPDGVALPSRAWANICPYLLDASGTWRAVQPSGEHRCTAVTPAEPLRADKQRRLCLVVGYLDCPTFLAAREVRARTLGEVAAVSSSRQFVRTAPVILQRPAAAAVALSTVRTSLPQVGLVLLMLLAAAALVLARFVTP
jgi:hypothetical protein